MEQDNTQLVDGGRQAVQNKTMRNLEMQQEEQFSGQRKRMRAGREGDNLQHQRCAEQQTAGHKTQILQPLDRGQLGSHWTLPSPRLLGAESRRAKKAQKRLWILEIGWVSPMISLSFGNGWRVGVSILPILGFDSI